MSIIGRSYRVWSLQGKERVEEYYYNEICAEETTAAYRNDS